MKSFGRSVLEGRSIRLLERLWAGDLFGALSSSVSAVSSKKYYSDGLLGVVPLSCAAELLVSEM